MLVAATSTFSADVESNTAFRFQVAGVDNGIAGAFSAVINVVVLAELRTYIIGTFENGCAECCCHAFLNWLTVFIVIIFNACIPQIG